MAAVAYIKLAKLIDLLKAIEPEQFVVSIATASRLSIGRDPLNPHAIVDLAQETVVWPDPRRAKAHGGLKVVP